MATFREVLRELHGSGVSLPEAEQMLTAAHKVVSGVKLSRVELYSSERECDRRIREVAGEYARARIAGKPLAYVLGVQEFLGHEYMISEGVLIPRQETELLVSVAAEELSTSSPLNGLEIGIGSGIISIELLSRLPGLKMLATEVSPAAAELAARNAESLLGARWADRLTVRVHSELFSVWPQSDSSGNMWDFVISNPPYLAATDDIAAEVIAHEPRLALFPQNMDPLHFYREIARSAYSSLRPHGLVFLELAHNRANETVKLFDINRWSCRLVDDLTGRKRILVGRKL